MKKIAIFTVHRAVNYGAALQMYALYRTLKELGADVDILDYRSEGIEQRENYKANLKVEFHIKSFPKNLFDQMDRFIALSANNKKKMKFEVFLLNTFSMSEECNCSNVNQMQNKYEMFIVGSDQVWNRNIINDDAYFLSFVDEKNKKFSYAASFGNMNGFNRDKIRNIELIKSFSGISVRERIGITELEDSCGVDVKVHLDPSFLLDMGQWNTMKKVPTKSNKNKPYILLYWASKKLKRLAVEIAKKNNWNVYDLNEGIPKGHMVNLKSLDPSEFIGVVSRASMVFTTSFHGMVFAILFHKPIKVDYGIKGEIINMRQHRILSMLHLEECNIQKYGGIEVDYNWNKVDEILNEERRLSIEYLTDIIK